MSELIVYYNGMSLDRKERPAFHSVSTPFRRCFKMYDYRQWSWTKKFKSKSVELKRGQIAQWPNHRNPSQTLQYRRTIRYVQNCLYRSDQRKPNDRPKS